MHGKQTVRIAPKRLRIEKITPASQNLADQYTEYQRIREHQKILVLPFAEDREAHNAADYTAVNRESSGSQIQDFEEISAVIFPLKNHIIETCAHHPDNDAKERKIIYRILSDAAPCRIPRGERNAEQHADADDDAVEGNRKSEYRDVILQVLNRNAEMHKT